MLIFFDVGRESEANFGFGGGGKHFCVGASPAHLELAIMLEALPDTLPGLQVAGPMKRTRGNIVMGVTELPVKFT